MRRKNLILCDKCETMIGDITPYGMKQLKKEKKNVYTGFFCSKCEKKQFCVKSEGLFRLYTQSRKV